MSEPTKADLAAAVTRLTQENAGLRDLLGAVSAYADMPHPADYNNSPTYEYELERRVDAIAIWANGDQEDLAPDVYVLVIQDRAKHLREEAARPVRYEVRAEPEPVSPEVAEPGERPVFEVVHADEGTPPVYLVGCGCQGPMHGEVEIGGPWYCGQHGDTTIVMQIPLASSVTA